MSALAQFNAIKHAQGSPADQQALLQNIMQTHGSATNFYRATAKEMGTAPDHVMEQIEQMSQQPQTGLTGANAGTAVPQTMTPPPQLNATKMDNNVRGLQGQGVQTAQAVNQSAQNPNNQFAKGGEVALPPDKTTIDNETQKISANDDLINAVKGLPVLNGVGKDFGGPPTQDVAPTNATPTPGHKPPVPEAHQDNTMKMLQQYRKEQSDSTGHPKFGGYAKGGAVHDQIKDMPLKDIIKLLASHPELAAMGANNGQTPPQGQPGGPAMASGGTLEADNITGYGPDGTPIIQNQDGTQGYGDVNQLLGRPKGTPTIGTGTSSSSSNNAANSVGNAPPTNMMAKGGEENPPPGALKEEVADDVPAKLSAGEFVMSADTTRFYGLKTLTALQDHARQKLAEMENSGGIRTPGDGRNPDQAQFTQDAEPNMNAYGKQQEPDNDDDSMVTGLLKECMGGANFSGGGPVEDWEKETGSEGATSISPHEYGPFGGSKSQTNDWINNNITKPDNKLDDIKTKTIDQSKDQLGENGNQRPRNQAHDWGDNERRASITKDVGTWPKDSYQSVYSDKLKSANEKKKGGLIHAATGGGIAEEQSLAKGGVVSATSSSLAPKKFSSEIPMEKIKTAPISKGGSLSSPPKLRIDAPRLAKGGLMKNVNQKRDINQTQAYIGS